MSSNVIAENYGKDYAEEETTGSTVYVLESFTESEEVFKIIDNLKNVCDDLRSSELLCQRFTFLLDNYQYQPHLLDHKLDSMLSKLLAIAVGAEDLSPLQHQAFKYMYIIAKVRNYKIVVRYLPHEVSDLEPVLRLLSLQNPTDHMTWESRYMLLLWLSIICIIPFDIAKLDSGQDRPVMDRLLDIAKMYLTVNDKSRDAAAYLLAKFITRPDIKKLRMAEFFEWSASIMNSVNHESQAGIVALTGVMSALALIFKHGKREDVFPFANALLVLLLKFHFKENKWTSIRKLAIKLVQRIGFSFLKTRIATWRYQRGKRSLPENLALNGAHVLPLTQTIESNELDEDEDYDVPEEMEEIIEQLLIGLKDKDTVIRWSAAKGIGRVTGRLPKELANEVVGYVLDLFTLSETDAAWHGGCLALAELSRRGLILPERLSKVVPVVLKALAYDDRRGNFSVGAHVRDAACYVCWAFARAYNPEEIKPYVNQIASALLIMTVFDREVNCRRAASAAFQENVGRQGTFPHGIDILTTADYFAVGSKINTYLNISVYIAQFPEYTHSLINYLLTVNISHWDSAIRELTSKALRNLTSQAVNYMAETVLPTLIDLTCNMDLNTRHCAILSVAEVTFALAEEAWKNNSSIQNLIKASTLEALKHIVTKLQEAKLFRGLGGEYTRQAVNVLIQKLSLAKVPFHSSPVIDVWQDLLNENLNHAEDNVQAGAVSALSALFTEYYKNPDGKAILHYQDKVLTQYIEGIVNPNQGIRVGYVSALGVLPKFLLEGKFDFVLNALISLCFLDNKKLPKLVEGHQEAIKAITRICITVGVSATASPDTNVCSTNFPHLMECLLVAMKDYTTDSRGDVGSKVREAAMQGLYELTILTVSSNLELLSASLIQNVMNCIIQQAVEKIDRTRSLAGEIFSKLLHQQSPEVPCIPEREHLLQIFPRNECDTIIWSAPNETFPRFIQLLSLPCYMYSVILGLAVSVGGLTESLVKHSSSCLISFLKICSRTILCEFCVTLITVFKDHQKIDRVTIPMFMLLAQLLAAGCLDILEEIDQRHSLTELLDVCKQEVAKSSDPSKLVASIDVFCGLLQFPEVVRKKSLSQLSLFLCHKYPRIRKATSIKLYEALVTFDDAVPLENLDEIMIILSDTNWDESMDKVKPIRNQLCELMDIPVPVSLTNLPS